MASPSEHLTPAETAHRSGFSLDTLRYYERIGLLRPPARTASGHRRFTPADLDWLGVLRCLRDTGMPIADMCRYAALVHQDAESTVPARLALLERHHAQVEEQLAELRRKQRHLAEKIGHYRSLLPGRPAVGGPDAAAPR